MTEKKVAEKKPEVKKAVAKKPTNGKGAVKETKRGPSGDSIGKMELTAMVAKALDYPVAPTKAIVDTLFETIIGQVKKGKVVVIQGLFKAQIVQKKARTARNPRTGESIKVPAKKAIKLKKANSLKL